MARIASAGELSALGPTYSESLATTTVLGVLFPPLSNVSYSSTTMDNRLVDTGLFSPIEQRLTLDALSPEDLEHPVTATGSGTVTVTVEYRTVTVPV